MSYFKALKLTKKGEQLQAKVNGNLSETLVFTRAKLGAGTITSEDEIRFLTDIKEMWGTANVSSCKIEGEDKNRVALELQFSNAELVEDKIFREIGLFAKGNDNEEILYAYANAGDKYDYIPLMRESPHSFIIVISFIIASGTKIEANIDLNSYISLKKFNEEMAKKANKTDRASTEEYGLTKYGTEEGTSLEGNKFVQMTGKDYGGILNIAGQKEAGKAYWDNNTKKLYICKNNNSDISPNVNNYIPFDSNSLLERLENLTRKIILLFYNGGSLVPNGTVSIPVNEDWNFFGIGVGTAVQSGKERMCFLFRTIFQSNNDILRFNGIEIKYNATDKTLKVINNGGNLYFLEQYSSLI
nr:MAG TPA: tail-collar fiber protein [Caudoviricetes sp.]